MSYGKDSGIGEDVMSVGAVVPIMDSCRATTVWTVERWGSYDVEYLKRYAGKNPVKEDFLKYGISPYSVTSLQGNLITNAGWTRLMSLTTATGSTQALISTSVRIGVGNGTTPAENYTDTDLAASSGSSNRWFQPVSGAASLGTRTISFTASFGGSDGNFAWNEFGLDVGTPTVTAGATVGTLLFNHKVGISQGTKASGQVWTTTATITFS